MTCTRRSHLHSQHKRASHQPHLPHPLGSCLAGAYALLLHTLGMLKWKTKCRALSAARHLAAYIPTDKARPGTPAASPDALEGSTPAHRRASCALLQRPLHPERPNGHRQGCNTPSPMHWPAAHPKPRPGPHHTLPHALACSAS